MVDNFLTVKETQIYCMYLTCHETVSLGSWTRFTSRPSSVNCCSSNRSCFRRLALQKNCPPRLTLYCKATERKERLQQEQKKNTPKILSKFDASTVNLYRIHLIYLITKYTKLQVSMYLIVLHGPH